MKTSTTKKKSIPWTIFWDMSSGGSTKQKPYDKIYIQAPIEEAKVIFYNRFGHNPEDVACSCCGGNYSIDEAKTFEQASGYHRDCYYDKKGYAEIPGVYGRYQTVEKYIQNKDVCVIKAEDIKQSERQGSLPEAYWPDDDEYYDS